MFIFREPPVISPDKGRSDDCYKIPELKGQHEWSPIEIGNALQQKASIVMFDANRILDSRADMQQALLMDSMVEVYRDIPYGEYTEFYRNIRVFRMKGGIDVIYKDPNRHIMAKWSEFGIRGVTVQFTRFKLIDRFFNNGELIQCIDTSYKDCGINRGYRYSMQTVQRFGNDFNEEVIEEIHCHQGIYSDDGIPCSVPQSWSLCPTSHNVIIGSFPSSTLNNS